MTVTAPAEGRRLRLTPALAMHAGPQLHDPFVVTPDFSGHLFCPHLRSNLILVILFGM